MAESPTVEGVKNGMDNGHALLDRAQGLNLRTQGELDEMHYEDIAQRLLGIVEELGALATKARELPVEAAQLERGKAEGQYDRCFEGTGIHPFVDALYANLGRMGQSHNGALESQRALNDNTLSVLDLLMAAVKKTREDVVPAREVLRERMKDANIYAEAAQMEGVKYKQII